MMTGLRTYGVLVAVASVVAATPGAAHAQATPEQKKKAKEHYEKGTTHYNLGRFDEAIDEFTKAFELYPEPVFLYNIAQSYRMKENWERARFFYKRYLSLAPDAKNRADVEQRIAEMDAELAKPKAQPTGPATGNPTNPTGPATGNPTNPTGPATGNPANPAGPATGNPTNPTGPATGNPNVAQNGGTDTGTGGTSISGGGDTGIVGEFHRDRPLHLGLAIGPGFVALGGKPPVPMQFTFDLSAGYLFTRGKLGLGAGTSFGFLAIPYDGQSGGDPGTAGLANWSVLGQLAYAITPKLDLRVDAGIGVTWFTGLAENNPFTSDLQAADGPVPMLTGRFGLGASWRFSDRLSATIMPQISRSSRPKNLKDSIDKVQQIDVLVGIGYSL